MQAKMVPHREIRDYVEVDSKLKRTSCHIVPPTLATQDHTAILEAAQTYRAGVC